MSAAATGVGPAFWLLAVGIIGGALGVVLLRNMVQSALCLGLVLLLVGGIYLNLHADLLAGFQVLLYVGAVVTLVLIAIMLIHNLAARYVVQTNQRWGLGAVAAVASGALLVWAINDTRWPVTLRPVDYSEQLRQFCLALLDKYILPFEVAAVVLLVALLGAIVFAQQTERSE
ncbi:MAG: NADH-quinone oxidoreductase subunit J [Fimbriimonadaceae bacterium]|nr:NADH-quinone oxidoreductase subunit J [Fimbriimonadaceae bacterium]